MSTVACDTALLGAVAAGGLHDLLDRPAGDFFDRLLTAGAANTTAGPSHKVGRT